MFYIRKILVWSHWNIIYYRVMHICRYYYYYYYDFNYFADDEF